MGTHLFGDIFCPSSKRFPARQGAKANSKSCQRCQVLLTQTLPGFNKKISKMGGFFSLQGLNQHSISITSGCSCGWIIASFSGMPLGSAYKSHCHAVDSFTAFTSPLPFSDDGCLRCIQLSPSLSHSYLTKCLIHNSLWLDIFYESLLLFLLV